jgi:hypothetical protein
MIDKPNSNDQQHPLWGRDRQTVNALMQDEPNEYNLAELARLRIRYTDFPGARDIQSDLDKIMKRWKLTEDALFEQTRSIHQKGQVYRGKGSKRDDWS